MADLETASDATSHFHKYCRYNTGSLEFAGGITTSDKLWQVLTNPADLARQVPRDRFNAEAFYHPDGTHHGTTNSIKGYWLDQDHRLFDAGFFRINCKEAEAMDPQQRMVLEVVYEAMVSAGYRQQDYAGKDVAVFAGVMTADYDVLSQRDELQTNQYYATGNARSMIANRISHFFDFRGPSMTIDSACSSSLVAVHQAAQSLRNGESTMACVAGVNLMLTPEHFVVESDMHMLSPSGYCHMWDARADGYARGEGVAAVLLKTLPQAIADGDRIHAVIRETGVNSDGRTEGLTMPNAAAQAALIRHTYMRAGLDARRVEDRCQYFEAHGTGTVVGDPCEAAAIKEAFFGAATETVSDKMVVGSVKTVVGHTEGAAGLAGLLKVVQALKHNAIPPNLHSDRPSEAVKPFLSHLEVPTQLRAWPQPARGQPRRASVNSFGFGGTNAHAIVESYDGVVVGDDDNGGDGDVGDDAVAVGSVVVPLCISAASPQALRALAESYRTFLHNHPAASVQLLACCLASRRDALTHRLALSVASRQQALAALDRLLDHETTIARSSTRAVTMDHAPQLLGIFTGQGAQWPTMARSLLRSNSVFRQTIAKLDSVLAACDDPPVWTLADQILRDAATSRVHEAAVAQPLCTAIQIALVDLLQSLGITLHTVIGHSSGEIAAAYAAGRLTVKDAILIAYYRGMVISQSLHSTDGFQGGMLAVGLSEKEAFGYCRDGQFAGKLFVAAGNAPKMATISGDLEMIKQAKADLDSKQILAKVLRVDAAYHSPHMAAAAADYMKALERCHISPMAEGNGVVWVSSVYGFKRTSEKDLGAGYWKDNMLYTVQFHDAVDHALSEFGPYDAAIEIGPHATLKLPVCQTATDCGQELPYVGMLDRAKDDSVSVADCLGFLWSTLNPIELHVSSYIEQTPNKKSISSYLAKLPAYPWDHCYPHYKESRLVRQRLLRECPPHELLGVRTPDDDAHVRRWRNVLKLDSIPWLQHHRFQGQCLLPASAYCVMALDACRTLSQENSPSTVELRDIEIASGVVIDEAPHGTEVMFTMMALPAGDQVGSSIEAHFCLASCPADGSADMRLNMTGKVRLCFDNNQVEQSSPDPLGAWDLLPTDSAEFYKMMSNTGLSYTGPFRGVTHIRRRFEHCSAQVANMHESDSTNLMISPATLDSCFQTAFLTYAAPGDRMIEGMQHESPSRSLSVDAHLTETCAARASRPTTLAADIAVFGERGKQIIQVENLVVRAIPNACTSEDSTSYLHTVLDLDPSHEIITMRSLGTNETVYDIDTPGKLSQTCKDQLYEARQLARGVEALSKHNPPAAWTGTGFYDHIGRIVQQIAHRHPRMNCLCLPDHSVQLPAHILRKIKGAFGTFTIGVKSSHTAVPHSAEAGKAIATISLDQGRCIGTQLERENKHDLVVLAVSHLENNDWADMLGLLGGTFESLKSRLLVQQPNISIRHSIMSDEECPLTTMMAKSNLSRFRSLFRPNMKVLWVIQNSWSGNPGHAAVLGFTRTIAAEIPNLKIQTLDLHDVSSPEEHIAEAFLQLSAIASSGSRENTLWTQEPEVYISGTRRLIPRIKPLREMNERALAFRRPLLRTVCTKDKFVVIRPCGEEERPSFFTAEVVIENSVSRLSPQAMVQVQYSSAYPVHLNSSTSAYVCLGRDTTTGEVIAGLTQQNLFDFSDLDDDLSHKIRSSLPAGFSYIQAKKAIFGTERESQPLWTDSSQGVTLLWENAVTRSMVRPGQRSRSASWNGDKAMSVPELLARTGAVNRSQLVDWTAAHEIEVPVMQIVEKNLLKSNKTYVLIGLTRDLGQSLCRLLVRHGAQNIVLASRNPEMSPPWAAELAHITGARIIIEKLDVTQLGQVAALKYKLVEEHSLPPVGGLINGAMVLDDRIFAHMTTETWERVMRPKAVGSRNLDTIFCEPDLEFFIMTSSFAAVGGHAGQSNYAAANMYMNGLAADRRRRGLAGSVLNIGVIYGLGFLHREKSELYAGLEREGYPPISERDVHHMVLEAIVAGRPTQQCGEGPYDIIAGLSRFSLDNPDCLHWQQDPRFSHLAILDSDDSTAEEQHPGATAASASFSDRLATVTEPREMQQLILEEFTKRLQVLLQTKPGSEICEDSRLGELGIDSLLAVDIRGWVVKKFGVDLAVMKILGPSSISKLCSEMAEQVLTQQQPAANMSEQGSS
ncbi:hypothetical protein Micbo1qcDRAFT_212101 [Microdochium bolleyi]|uniref:Uncharacterized protein n=1 Tax=Microdochium bolleyi TaxID=196109 RepID=A0A136IXL6_9PEZI|nr:hypothetical protein Micbo1qcDRAFT_212101 [Microdochium bolleyi]